MEDTKEDVLVGIRSHNQGACEEVIDKVQLSVQRAEPYNHEILQTRNRLFEQQHAVMVTRPLYMYSAVHMEK